MRSPSLLASGLSGVALAATLTGTITPGHAQATRFVPCSGPNGGPDGLVQAINQVQNNGGSALIELEKGCTYTFTAPRGGNNALPVITGRIAITGKNAVIARSANAATDFRIAEVAPSGFLSLTGVTIRGGSTTGNGGGILNRGTLSLKFTTLTGNKARNGSGGGFAATEGSLTLLYRSTISGNTAALGGGGVTFQGTLRAIATLFTRNAAVIGGALALSGQSKLVGTVVTGNHALGEGGGIVSSGSVQIRDSKITRNTADTGGGLYADNAAVAEFLRSHVTANKARTTGGGIFAVGTVTLQKSRVTGNVPDNCAGPATVPGCVNKVKDPAAIRR